MRALVLLSLMLSPIPATASAAQADAPAQAVAAEPSAALKARIDGLADMLAGKARYEDYFSAAFRAQVPPEAFARVNQQLTANGGPLTGIEGYAAVNANAAVVKVGYRDAIATMQIAVDSAAPNPVIGLRVTQVTPRNDHSGAARAVQDVAAQVQALRGTAGFAVARLGEDAPQLLASAQPDRAFAVGSAFKLVILAELVRATNAGERAWDDPVTLDGSPLPGGGYAQKPAGTQVTLRELATQMISISDNSATDVLLRTLGRAKVEAMLPAVGVQQPAANRPYLATLDMFKLKGVPGLAPRYLALDQESERRALLEGEVAKLPLSAIDQQLFAARKPLLIDRLEWFFTPADMVRIMDWLRRNTDGPSGADARAILSKNPGIPPDVAGRWKWIGFKGGSEPGVVNLTLLLQDRAGDWYAITGSWNDTAQDVEIPRFAALMTRAAELLLPPG